MTWLWLAAVVLALNFGFLVGAWWGSSGKRELEEENEMLRYNAEVELERKREWMSDSERIDRFLDMLRRS